MQLIQTVAPTTPALSLDEAKAFLRILDNDDDTLIASIIDTVTDHTQKILNRQLPTATYELYDSDLITKLPLNPVKGIASIEFMDASGDYVTLEPTSYYLYERNGIGCINYSIVPDLIQHEKAVKITFVCGYGTIPEPIKHYMKIMISTLFEHREEYVIGTIVSKFDKRYALSLLDPYRIIP